MNKNNCPYCSRKISLWRKWQLTDNKYGRTCPHCKEIITLSKWNIRFIYFFNLAAAVILVVVTYRLTDTRIPMLAIGAVILIIFNLILIQLMDILRKEK